MRPLLITLLLTLTTVAARAGGDVSVVVTGETMQRELVGHLEAWLRAHGHPLVATPLPQGAVNTLIDCFVIEDAACARAVIKDHARSPIVMFARVEADTGGSHNLTVTVHWFDRGSHIVAAVSERRRCERCTDHALRAVVDELMPALAVAARNELGNLRLSSSPAGARVLVDGEPVGVTPLEYPLAEGDHEITLARDHHHDATRAVTIRKGETTPIEVSLVAVEAPARAPIAPLAPITAIAGGATLLIAGILVYRLAEPDTGETPEFHDDRNHALGIGMSVTGLVAAGIGTYFLLTRRPRSAPAVALLPGGAYVGWTRSF